MLIGMGAMIRAQALNGIARSTQIMNPMPITPPTIFNTEIIRTQVFDIQPSFPVDARWRLTHALCSRAGCLRADSTCDSWRCEEKSRAVTPAFLSRRYWFVALSLR